MTRKQPVAMKGMILVALTMAAVMSVGIVAGSAFGAAPTGVQMLGGSK